MIKVSVVVNTVDRPEDLRRCLLSVLGQSFRDFEIVVVNNGIGSETEKLLDELKAKSGDLNIPFKIISDKTKKLSYLFNIGWRNTNPQSVYLAYCADDTEADKDWLKYAVEYLDNHTDCGAVSGPMISTANPPGEMFYLRDLAKKNIFTRIFLRLYEYFVMEDRTMDPGFWPQSGAFTMGAGIPLPHIKEPIEIDLLTSGNMVAARTAVDSVDGFDENFYFNHADGDLYIRMKKAGFKMVFHPKVSVIHHMRFGPTRYPWILGRDTAFYYLKDVRPKSLRGWIGAFINLAVFNGYFIFKALQLRKISYLRGISGFFHGLYDFFSLSSRERSEVLITLLPIAVFLLLFTQAVRSGFVAGMPAFGDSWPFPPTVGEALKNFFSPWDLRSPGIVMPVQPVISVLTIFEALAGSLLLGSMITAARLFYFYLPLPLMFISMYWFLGKFLKSKTARFVASFIYSVNYFTIGELLGGFVPTLYVQVLFPLILYSLYRRRLFNFSLLFAAAFVLSDHVVLFIAPFFLVYVLWRLISEGLIGFLKSGFFIVSAVVIVVLLTLHYTFYYFNLALPFLGGGSLRSDVLEFLIGNVRDTYRNYSVIDVIRLGGNYFSSLYSLGPIVLKLGFLVPILSLAWVLFPANWKKRRLLTGILFSFLSFSTVVFIYLTHKFVTIPFFVQFPFLFRFRNPARPTLFLALAYTPLIALTVDGCISFVRNKTYPKVLPFIVSGAGVLALVALALYSKPFFSGDYTFSKNRGSTYTIPEYYYEVGNWLKTRRAQEGEFRTLWLPYNHEEAEIKIRYVDPLSYSVPINYGAYTTNKYLTNMKEIYLSLDRLATDSSRLLAFAGVKYVVINTNAATAGVGRARFEYGYQTPWLIGSPGAWEVAIITMGDFRLVEDLGLFKIYENLAYRVDGVDPILAGWPPSNINQLQFTKNVLMVVAFLVLVASVFMASKEIKKNEST